MKTERTQGNWKAFHCGVYQDQAGYGQSVHICDVETNFADARLIATAPELLEVLEQAERVFNVETIDPMQAFLMIEKMRAKIAKAKGETI